MTIPAIASPKMFVKIIILMKYLKICQFPGFTETLRLSVTV